MLYVYSAKYPEVSAFAMNIAVFSDTHGRTRGMLRAIAAEQPDLVFHLGDNERDAQSILRANPVQALLVVCGNCDYSPEQPETREVTLEGVKFYATHGHRHRVKYELETILNVGHFSGADVVLFGHSHRAVCEQVDGMWVINPGTSGLGETPTYALIRLKDGSVASCEIKPIPKGS